MENKEQPEQPVEVKPGETTVTPEAKPVEEPEPAEEPKPAGAKPAANVSQQTEEVLQQPAITTPKMQMKPMKRKHNVAAMLLGVIAVAGIGAAVYFGMQYFNEKDRADKLAAQSAAAATAPTEEVAEETDGSTTEVATNDVDTSKYIYVGEWGQKIKVPDNLKYVSHNYTMWADGTSSVGVYGVKDGVKQYDFANPNAFAGGSYASPLGYIARAEKGYWDECKVECGQKVFVSGDYEYRYTHPQALWSTDAAEQEIEMASVELIKTMLVTEDNYSKI